MSIIQTAKDGTSYPSVREQFDVYVAPSGAVFEYGPAVMRVKGKATPCDRVAFVQHCRAHGFKAKTEALVCGIRVSLW